MPANRLPSLLLSKVPKISEYPLYRELQDVYTTVRNMYLHTSDRLLRSKSVTTVTDDTLVLGISEFLILTRALTSQVNIVLPDPEISDGLLFIVKQTAGGVFGTDITCETGALVESLATYNITLGQSVILLSTGSEYLKIN